MSKHTAASVGPALYLYKCANAKDAQTIPSALKKLFPAAADLEPIDFQHFLNSLPLTTLSSKLAPDRASWAPDVQEEMLARLPECKTYFKDYPRFIKRFLKFTADAGLVMPSPSCIMPEWEDFMAKAARLMPQSKKELAALAAAGVTLVLEKYPIHADNLKATNIKLQNVRSAMRNLARIASASDLTPQAFAEAVLTGDRQNEVAAFAGQSVYYSYCRCVWNETVKNFPELDLPPWPDRRRHTAIAMEQWPAPLRQGVNAAVFERPGMRPLAPASVKNYRDTLCTFVGILAQAGLDPAHIVDGLSPKDAVRLIFQGWPRERLTGSEQDDSALSIYRKLFNEAGYRDQVLAEMKAEEQMGKGTGLTENPFVAEVLAERYSDGKYRSAEKILDRVFGINNEYLCMRGDQLKWLKRRLNQVATHMSNHETAYDQKKQVVFQHPHLFETLIARAEVLYREHQQRFSTRGSHWATFIRDLTYFVLVTLYPLRVRNHQLMKLGSNYDPERHVLMVHRSEVKNKKTIEFELPLGGALGWVRELVELYLTDARPVLLRSAASDYFFVGNHQAPNANGFLQRQAFNELLIDFAEKYLGGVLPTALGYPNPHLFRHIVATYQIAIRLDPNMAARLLNDKIETIYKHYADILGSSRVACKDFYEAYSPSG